MLSRRIFLQNAMFGMASLSLLKNQSVWSMSRFLPFGLEKLSRHTYLDRDLMLELPQGCKARIIARSGRKPIPTSNYVWHGAPDGGACFDDGDGGWFYVSNSEQKNNLGGAGAVHFDKTATIVDAYSILQGTNNNCAGGKSSQGTWLSCEENGELGQVYECDPRGIDSARVLPALGSFNHEAVTTDPDSGFLYMTEDVKDGALYRFIPEQNNDLTNGQLEVAINNNNRLGWKKINDPDARITPCRYQVNKTLRFKGGEGIIYRWGNIYFVTKIDNRVWQYNIKSHQLDIVYDVKTSINPVLSGVDNMALAPAGELIIAEDGGNMQLIALTENFKPFPLVMVLNQDRSEITGPAFSPDGRRLYFSSQRGVAGKNSDGITYEIEFPEAIEMN